MSTIVALLWNHLQLSIALTYFLRLGNVSDLQCGHLFLHINDSLDNLKSTGKLFADDAKIYSRIRDPDDTLVLQNDLNKLQEWSSKWLLSFNESKCKVLHVGRGNPGHIYVMGGVHLELTTAEKDLGIIVSTNLKPEIHINKIVVKVNQILGRLKSTFTYMDVEMFLALYLGIVRPLMLFAAQVWSPQNRGNINKLEKVEKRATKLVPGLSDLPYERRLHHLGLTTLEERRAGGDMIQVFKILQGYEDIDPNQFFKVAVRGTYTQGKTRGHSLKLLKPTHPTTKRNQCFDARVMNQWNKLPQYIVNDTTVNAFKNNYDNYIKV